MKNIFSAKWKYENKVLYLIILICFSFIAYYHLSSGYSMSSDSQRYSRWADDLIRFDFNFYDFFLIDTIEIRPHLLFFSVPVLLIALCKVIFLNEWQFAFLLLNLSLVFFSLIIFVKSLLLVNVRPILISLTLPLIVVSVDILIWPKFILTDMIYAFLVLIATYFIIKGITQNKIYYFNLFVIMCLLFTTRPSSFPVIFVIIFSSLILNYSIILKPKIILLLLISAFTFTPFIYSLIYFFIELNLNGNIRLDFITSMVNDGIIIHDRPETWVDKPKNFADVAYIYFLRLINFFSPYASSFSLAHIALNLFQIALVLLSIFIWFFFGGHLLVYNKIFLFILMLSFFIAAFHSFILIDYDWRYRFPIILPLILLFPISLEAFVRKFKIK
tara:strand:+ start:2846 stop:4006 length:1161 start_codon:yes stop_codon:yes gene_type:complete